MIKFASFFTTLCLILFSYTVNSTTLLIVGDSLSAGYRMPTEQSWPVLLPAKLTKHLKQQDTPIKVINASISGDTTGNGLARLTPLLSQHKPDYVLIELGANDGLRGFSPSIVSKNLGLMIENIQAKNAKPILMQIYVPTNYGKRYSNAFAGIYPALSAQHKIPLVPFFLEHVITQPQWMMSDGLHPNAQAQPWIAEFMAKELINVMKDKKK